jgi:hypothetical protein
MLKIKVKSTLEKAHEFIDNRLILLLAEKRLCVSETSKFSLFINKKNIVKQIQNTIYYLEKEPKRSTIIIAPTEKKGSKIKQYLYGVALREKNADEIELYIDTFKEALKKGIISKQQLGNNLKIIYIVAVILAIMAMFVMFPVVVAAVILTIFLYPVIYMFEKKRFEHNQNIMKHIVSIFESEFETSDKSDTKDWITFWMKVKTGVSEAMDPF